jgi:hypothetical protein
MRRTFALRSEMAFVSSPQRKKVPGGIPAGEKGAMKSNTRVRIFGLLFAGALVFSVSANAQQKAANTLLQSRAYNLQREVFLLGTVVEYKAQSSTSPLGAHVTVQTSAGIVDVHLGDPRMFTVNHFSLAPGDAVRIVGESVSGSPGGQFLARIVQKGTQALEVRSPQGIPLKPGHAATTRAQANTRQGGAL